MTTLRTDLIGKRVLMTGNAIYYRYNDQGQHTATACVSRPQHGRGKIRAMWLHDNGCGPAFLVQSDDDGNLYSCGFNELQIIT